MFAVTIFRIPVFSSYPLWSFVLSFYLYSYESSQLVLLGQEPVYDCNKNGFYAAVKTQKLLYFP